VQDVLGADALRYFLLREIPFGQDGSFSFEALVPALQPATWQTATAIWSAASSHGAQILRGGVAPVAGLEDRSRDRPARERGRRTDRRLRAGVRAMNFSEALKALWLLGRGDRRLPDGPRALEAGPPTVPKRSTLRSRRGCWPRPPRPFALSPRWSIPSCRKRPPKVWRKLGQGEIQEAAKQAFLRELAWAD